MPTDFPDLREAATLIVAASDSLHPERADYVCPGLNDQNTIQNAINALPANGGSIQLLDGTFDIRDMITGANYVDIAGVGFGTIFDVTNIGANDIITLGDYSSLEKLKISGTVTPFPIAFSQQTIVGNHCEISDVWITDVGSGIETIDKNDVVIENVILTNIRDASDYASAIHASGSSNRIYVRNFYIEGCNRALEIEDGAQWVTVENGFIKDIQNYNATGNESFCIDVHTHGTFFCKHIKFKNIYLENTYPPRSDHVSHEDLIWENIYMSNPHGTIVMRITAKNVLLKNVYGWEYPAEIRGEHFLIENCENPVTSNITEWKIFSATDITIRNCIMNVRDHVSPHEGVLINDSNAADIRIIDNTFLGNDFPSAVYIENALRGIIIKGNRIDSPVPTVTGLVGLAIAYDKNPDLFMDVLAVSATHVVDDWDVSAAGEIELNPAAGNNPDVPRTLSWNFVQHTTVTEFDLVFEGVDGKGNSITETFDETAGWAGETSNAFATISAIKYTRQADGGDVGNIIDIGITDVLGLSNIIYATSDVYKIKKNPANVAVAAAQVDTDYDTYDMAVIGLAGGDDFTIWFRSNLNIIS